MVSDNLTPVLLLCLNRLSLLPGIGSQLISVSVLVIKSSIFNFSCWYHRYGYNLTIAKNTGKPGIKRSRKKGVLVEHNNVLEIILQLRYVNLIFMWYTFSKYFFYGLFALIVLFGWLWLGVSSEKASHIDDLFLFLLLLLFVDEEKISNMVGNEYLYFWLYWRYLWRKDLDVSGFTIFIDFSNGGSLVPCFKMIVISSNSF